jgi:hypothetical protein
MSYLHNQNARIKLCKTWQFISHTVADPSFVGPEAYTNFGGPLYEKAYKIKNTKVDTEVNIYLGPFQGLEGARASFPL